MFKMRKFFNLMVVGMLIGVSAVFVIHEPKIAQNVAAAENDKFIYDGFNESKYNGEAVFIFSDIADQSNLFKIKSKLKSVKTVIIDDNVENLDISILKHFQDAPMLHIGKKVKTIHWRIWGETYMKALSTIEVDKENPYFTVKDNVLYSSDMKTLLLYPAEKKDTSFSIPDTVVKVAQDYMGENGYLHKLNIGKSLALESPYITYDDLVMLTSDLFSLQKITVDASNVHLSIVDGVLYNKEQTQTIAWPNDLIMENVTFPSTLQSIALDMIGNKDQVKTITLSQDMEELWVYDFTSRLHNFKNLEKITVPSENKHFTVWKDGLYNKEKTTFYGFPRKSPVTTMELSEGVTEAELWTYVYPNIEKVIIPSTFTDFYTHEGGGFTMFHEMFPNLKCVEISSGCRNYKSIDGVVYNKKGTKLITYPNKKKGSYIISSIYTLIPMLRIIIGIISIVGVIWLISHYHRNKMR